MLIETYEEQEIIEQKPEQVEACKDLIEQLGLEGQRRFVERNESGKASFPYRKLTAEELHVYETLLPVKTELTKYRDAMIPLRVLQVAALVSAFALKDGVLEVWHPANGDYKDPLLILRIGEGWGPRERFILARWGDVLDNFETLRTKALTIWSEHVRTKIAAAIKRLETDADMIESKAAAYVRGESIGEPFYSGW